ncbi:MAG: metallophosphoesterase [Lachnospiraceae bacterium]|nr:metallophosphoesterase [Lachnospiraceae bacterium]
MKVLVISDTHGRRETMERLLETDDAKDADWIIHCGDIGYDDEWLRYAFRGAVTIVCGNCDFGSDLPREAVVEREGVKFYVTHGHRYLMGGLDRLAYRAQEVGASVVLFGHTHIPYTVEEDGIRFLNPGSLALPRQSDRRKTYGVITVEQGSVTAKIRELAD